MKISLARPLARETEWCLRANRRCDARGLRAGLRLVSRLGDGVFWYALMTMLVMFGGSRGAWVALQLAATGLASLALYKLLKRWTRRPRPCAADARIKAWIAPLDEFSFPSGHTLHAVAFTVVATAHFPVFAWLLVPFTACVAASRVLLGLHYPSDVLAAIAIGVTLGRISLLIAPWMGVSPVA